MAVRLPCDVRAVGGDLLMAECDGIIFVCSNFERHKTSGYYPADIISPIKSAEQIDAAIHSEGGVLAVNLPCRRLVYSPTGPLSKDFDDVRSFAEAAANGIRRAIKAGSESPILVLPCNDDYLNCDMQTLLGALEALYLPIQFREDCPQKAKKLKVLNVWAPVQKRLTELLKFGLAVEEGRYVARDIGGGDPERMAPLHVAEYVSELFKNSPIKVTVIKDQKELDSKYPLFSAVNRAASVIPRHQGCVVWLEYKGEGKTDSSLLLVGKGVTYDTGGADIKAGGVMAGMSRDKCGAAAIAGFFQTLAKLQPKQIAVKGVLGMVRNSVGENCYVADEVITSRAGVRVRVGNTDAEGRMVMVDLLCQMKEEAQKFVNPHLMTIATLTGHAVLTVGMGYSIVIDNAVARKVGHAQKLQIASEEIGDPFEISTVRREDFNFVKDKGDGVDVLQCNNAPSSRTQRGHQMPTAFLLTVSGLDQNGLDSKQPLKYSHLDIAASAGDLPYEPTGAPILALSYMHLTDRF